MKLAFKLRHNLIFRITCGNNDQSDNGRIKMIYFRGMNLECADNNKVLASFYFISLDL